MKGSRFQTALGVIFPPRCVGCGGLVDSDFGLCGSCWGQTPFITGLVCDACGIPVQGQSDGVAVQCDDCLETPRPWTAGRSVMLYEDRGRHLVLGLKHGQRTDVAKTAGVWMEQAARDLWRENMIVAPVPLHWTRLFQRSFNQSALLARAVTQRSGHQLCPDLLERPRRTAPLEEKTVYERFEMLDDAIAVPLRRQALIVDRPVLLVDDVMTSGATLAAATRACQSAGSGDVFVLTLARVAKRP